MIIFLDIDGVLNDHAFDEVAESCTIKPSCVNELNTLLRDTNAKLVISSAWRYMVHGEAMTPIGFDYLLRTHGVMSKRIIGLTQPDELEIVTRKPESYTVFGSRHYVDGGETKIVKTDRSQQVTLWNQRWNKDHQPYVVIDDLPIIKNHPFVRTNGKVGLTWMERIQAELLLRSQRG